MQNFDDKVMVALLPTESSMWGQVDLPHLTLVYAGSKQDLSMLSLDGLSKAALAIALMNNPVTLSVLTKDVFGDGTEDSPKVDVLRFHTTLGLIRMREIVQDWNVSKHPFAPHMTVGPEGSWVNEVPRIVNFDRVAFVNGSQRQEFRMSRSAYP